MSSKKLNLKNLASMIAKSIPSDEEMIELRKNNIERAKTNPTAFHNWFWAVVKQGIPHPESKEIPFNQDLADKILDLGNELPAVERGHLDSMVLEIREFGKKIGYPLFLKSSLFSSKHDWVNSCFISKNDSDDDVANKIVNIYYASAMVGVPRSLNFVIREFVDTVPAFTAFKGKLPITEEYRLFVKGGEVVAWQPYWPESSILEPSDEDWKDKLKAIKNISDKDLSLLVNHAERVCVELGGDWSVDFLKGADGKFYLIDMAELASSFIDRNGGLVEIKSGLI